jgi:nucleoside-diphosphate-sugar epimerase
MQRIVLASSIMVNWGYLTLTEPYKSVREMRDADIPADYSSLPLIKLSDPVRPTENYGCSKVFAEACARMHAGKPDGPAVFCMRFGWVNSEDNWEADPGLRSVMCKQAHCVRVLRAAILATHDAVSNNSDKYRCYYVIDDDAPYRWVDLTNTNDLLAKYGAGAGAGAGAGSGKAGAGV